MNNDSKSPIKWMNNNLNNKSKTFCGAKWYNATIWLGNGMTASCHHPPPHQIDPNEVKNNPSALHNTLYKKIVRKEMQEGKQTRECEYCWKIENLQNNIVSDRYFKSVIYSEEDLDKAFNTDWREDIAPKTIEIAFDNNCNFACSYCNAGYSTTWSHDIKKNGAYQDLQSDGWGAFATEGKWAQPYSAKNENNPYIEAFWKWWETDLQYSLNELRVTGGEATISNEFWTLIDWFENNPACKVKLAVNTNLGVKKDKLERLIESSRFIKNLDIYTSNESFGDHAEYIRDGLLWKEWTENIEQIATESNLSGLHVMLTINALCLASLDKFHEYIFELKDRTKKNIFLSHNLLRFPSFQSITTLPDHIRKERAEYYQNWMTKHEKFLNTHEVNGLNRTIEYIKNIDEGHSVRKLSDLQVRQNDFFNFYSQYDIRRNKLFEKTFADWPNLVEWYQTLTNNSNDFKIQELIEANAVDWGKEIFDEVKNNAVTTGLIKSAK